MALTDVINTKINESYKQDKLPGIRRFIIEELVERMNKSGAGLQVIIHDGSENKQ